PALLLQAAVSLAARHVEADERWARLRRAGIAVLAVTAGWTVMATAGLSTGLLARGLELRGTDLLWVVPSWMVWFAVDVALGSAVAGDRGVRLSGLFVRE